jgi:hypothetical protein
MYCHKSIEEYKQIKEFVKERGGVFLLFLDLIIRLTLMRAYANQINRKQVTAGRLLDLAEEMIKRIKRQQESKLIGHDDDLSSE